MSGPIPENYLVHVVLPSPLLQDVRQIGNCNHQAIKDHRLIRDHKSTFVSPGVNGENPHQRTTNASGTKAQASIGWPSRVAGVNFHPLTSRTAATSRADLPDD
jgi:hypothetical protein